MTAETAERYSINFIPDFRIADAFGEDAIRDTYKRAAAEWTDPVGASVLELDLCAMIHIWHTFDDESRMELYFELFRKQRDLNLERAELDDEFSEIHFEITD